MLQRRSCLMSTQGDRSAYDRLLLCSSLLYLEEDHLRPGLHRHLQVLVEFLILLGL